MTPSFPTRRASGLPPDYRLVVSSGQANLSCPSTICKLDRSSNVWWAGDGKKVIFTRREGWANSLTGIYTWKPGDEWPKRVLVTGDALIECQPLRSEERRVGNGWVSKFDSR